MNPVLANLNRIIGVRMAASGRFALIETIGRRTGRPRTTPVGFAEGPGESLYVGAGHPDAHWAANLIVTPSCRVSLRGRVRVYGAQALEGAVRDEALGAIRARYGPGMADRIGAGPVFRLVLREDDPTD